MVGSVRPDRVPSSTEHGEQSEKEKKNKSPCSSHCGLAALQRGHRHRLHRRYCCLFFGRSGLDDYILAAVPSGAAQEARYPAGTLGDIQAVTLTGMMIRG